MLYHIDSPQNRFCYPQGEVLPLVFSGWATTENAPALSISAEIGNKSLFSTNMNILRNDVQAVFPEMIKDAQIGFKVEVLLPSNIAPGIYPLDIYATDSNNHKQLLQTLEFEIFDSTQADFSKRFSAIPRYLLMKVNGDESEESFHIVGSRISSIVDQALSSIPNANTILDFGSGIGRVLNPLANKYGQARFTGFDIDPSMIAWAKYLHKDSANHFTNDITELEKNAFDFIYAISVFTHLDQTTETWLEKISSLLSSGGQALITYHDETLFSELAGTPMLPGISANEKLTRYYVAGKDTPEGDAFMGTFYTTKYWEELASKYFNIISTTPRGVDGYQSYSILAKR